MKLAGHSLFIRNRQKRTRFVKWAISRSGSYITVALHVHKTYYVYFSLFIARRSVVQIPQNVPHVRRMRSRDFLETFRVHVYTSWILLARIGKSLFDCFLELKNKMAFIILENYKSSNSRKKPRKKL